MRRVLQKHVFWDLFHCHTKRRWGPTNPSFGMTPTMTDLWSVSYQKRDWRGPVHQSFFWYDNDYRSWILKDVFLGHMPQISWNISRSQCSSDVCILLQASNYSENKISVDLQAFYMGQFPLDCMGIDTSASFPVEFGIKQREQLCAKWHISWVITRNMTFM